MDVKASARAKHASSQRGRARHSTRKHQPQQQQQQQQQSVSDPQQPQDKKDSKLPSNWSRYEEETAEEEALHDDRVSDVPPVKSRGANYKDLLAEKSMLQGPDLASGRKSLMVTRGLDLWSRLTDMDNMWSTNEVSGEEVNYFTLDLDFLNKELSKIDIAERLLLDPEYVHHREIEKERGYKNPGIETGDEDSSIKTPALSSPSGLDSSTPTGNEEFGGGVNKSRATPKLSGTYAADPSLSKESEMVDGIMQSVSEEPLVPLPKTTPLFDVRSAEAELDALLDMLDNRTVGQASNLAPMEPLGSASQGSHPYVVQERGPLDIPVDSSHGTTTLFSNFGAPNDSPRHMIGPTKLAGEASNVSFHVPNVDPRNIVDEDFDDWLDNL